MFNHTILYNLFVIGLSTSMGEANQKTDNVSDKVRNI